MEKNYDPVIVFAFSKKDCELLAQSMAKLDFNSGIFNICFDNFFNQLSYIHFYT